MNEKCRVLDRIIILNRVIMSTGANEKKMKNYRWKKVNW